MSPGVWSGALVHFQIRGSPNFSYQGALFLILLFVNAVYDSVLAGGGDGTLNHVLDALVRKRLRESGQEAVANRENPMLLKPNITVGVLPVTGSIHSFAQWFIHCKSKKRKKEIKFKFFFFSITTNKREPTPSCNLLYCNERLLNFCLYVYSSNYRTE